MKRSYELEIILKNCCHKKSILQRFRSSSFPLNKSNPAEKVSWTNQICSQSVLQDHVLQDQKPHLRSNFALYFDFEQIPNLHNRGKCQIIHIEKVNGGPKYQGHVYLSFFQDSINKRIL